MYQFVHDAVDYIENNWKNIGKVGRFKIYETIENKLKRKVGKAMEITKNKKQINLKQICVHYF